MNKPLPDTPWNRMKMRWYIKGMQRALIFIDDDDGHTDPRITRKQIKEEIKEVATEWDIKL